MVSRISASNIDHTFGLDHVATIPEVGSPTKLALYDLYRLPKEMSPQKIREQIGNTEMIEKDPILT